MEPGTTGTRVAEKQKLEGALSGGTGKLPSGEILTGHVYLQLFLVTCFPLFELL